MSNIAQKRPFASLVDEETTESTPPPSPPPSQPLHASMTPAEKKWCAQTIKSLKKHKRAIAFLDPVDPIQFNIPDYFDIIKSPMDLGTVERKLTSEQYSSMDAFKSDVQLIFDNCYLYNNAGDPVCQDAKKLEEHYIKLCKKGPSLHSPMVSAKVPRQQLEVNDMAAPNMSSTDLPMPDAPVLSPQRPIPTSTNTNSSTSTNTSTITIPLTRPHTMPHEQFERCEAIVKELKKSKYKGINWPFANPVDADAWGATDYYEVIKNPMDMTTYEQKLYSHKYANEDEFEQDIRLMFKNCYTYNPPNHLVHELGKEFEAVFDKYWAKLHGSSKKSSKHSKHKKQRTSSISHSRTADALSDPDTTYSSTDSQLPPLQSQPSSSISPPPLQRTGFIDRVNSVHSSTATATATVTPNQSRPTILRVKLSVKPKDEQQQQQPKKEATEEQTRKITIEKPKPKPTVKIPGLALSKEPPAAASATSNPAIPSTAAAINAPKLAIGNKLPSPVKDKKIEKPASTVLYNHDKWLAIANNAPTKTHAPYPATTTGQKKLSPVSSAHLSPVQATAMPTSATSAAPPPPPPPSPKASAAKSFDINVLYNQIHNEKKLKEQQKREEQDRWEKNERIRLEKERIASEARLNKLRELNQQAQARRQQDKIDRQRDLDKRTIDISKQKLLFARFESAVMARDQDWRELYTWQRDTNDYRHIPVPGFVKRAPMKIPDLRKRLLSKCVRLENSRSSNQDAQVEDEGESDMDVD